MEGLSTSYVRRSFAASQPMAALPYRARYDNEPGSFSAATNPASSGTSMPRRTDSGSGTTTVARRGIAAAGTRTSTGTRRPGSCRGWWG
ncbi:hypothetical protein [Nonomuraea rubra]|uniref:hypothetical protein n=1 Tax=Nonomuraea rubra TaxID=46180 RepID=UPI0033EFF5BB